MDQNQIAADESAQVKLRMKLDALRQRNKELARTIFETEGRVPKGTFDETGEGGKPLTKAEADRIDKANAKAIAEDDPESDSIPCPAHIASDPLIGAMLREFQAEYIGIDGYDIDGEDLYGESPDKDDPPELSNRSKRKSRS